MDKLLRETKPAQGYLPEVVPGQHWNPDADGGNGGYEKNYGSGGAARVLLWGLDGSALLTEEKPGHVDVIDRAGREIGKVSADNLDIALSVLRDAITKTGETSKTLADVVSALASTLNVQLTGSIPEYSWFDSATPPTPAEPTKLAWGYNFNTTTGVVTVYGWSGTAWVEVV